MMAVDEEDGPPAVLSDKLIGWHTLSLSLSRCHGRELHLADVDVDWDFTSVVDVDHCRPARRVLASRRVIIMIVVTRIG
eukprot:419356-Prymnesium_polylepis.2